MKWFCFHRWTEAELFEREYKYYKGLDVEEWTNKGPKKESERMFMEDEDLMKDAKKLIFHLINKAPTNILSTASMGEVTHGDLKEGGVDIEDDITNDYLNTL